MNLLDAHPLFATLSEARREALLSSSERRRVAAGQPILRAGERAGSVFVLLSGTVRVFHELERGEHDDDGAEIVVKAFSAPALFGEAEALMGWAYVQSASATDPCDLLAVTAERFTALLKEEPAFCFAVCKDLAARLAISSYHEKSIAFHPATVRLANYMLDCATHTDEGLQIALSQTEMARAIGVTRRSIAKDMAEWQRDGILARTAGGGYRVLDVEKLRRYADPDRLSLHYSLG